MAEEIDCVAAVSVSYKLVEVKEREREKRTRRTWSGTHF